MTNKEDGRVAPGNDALAPRQLSLFPESSPEIERLYNWLLGGGRELDRLERLFAEVKAHPQRRQSTEYKVKRPDGSVYVPPKLTARWEAARAAHQRDLRARRAGSARGRRART